jgi:hypothetical protein
MTFIKMIFNLMIFNIMTLSKKGLFMTLSITTLSIKTAFLISVVMLNAVAPSVPIMNSVTTKAGAEHELLSNKQATVPKHSSTIPIALQI